jgi:hypothetical protein
MEILTPKATRRRSTRVRVEIAITVTSLDRKNPFSGECLALLISPQGCGLRVEQGLPLETPLLLSGLPGGGSASGRVASCLPLGGDGKYFLIGVALYNHGNVWGIPNPPEDWNCAPDSRSQPAQESAAAKHGSNAWPYNLASAHGEVHPRRK